jgi:hypothetical protein
MHLGAANAREITQRDSGCDTVSPNGTALRAGAASDFGWAFRHGFGPLDVP